MKPTIDATEPRQLMAEHLEVLRGYASRVVGHNQVLSAEEQAEKETRVEEFLALGKSFGLTRRELVSQILGDALKAKRSECGCPTCRSRARMG
jgi:hypothetical protein